jgi:hypothetical protein
VGEYTDQFNESLLEVRGADSGEVVVFITDTVSGRISVARLTHTQAHALRDDVNQIVRDYDRSKV